MATALQEIEGAQLIAQVMSAVTFDMRSLTPGQYPILERATILVPPAQPQRVLVREIDLAPMGSNHPVGFINPDRSHDIADFADVLASVIDRSYTPNSHVFPYYRPLDVKLRVPTRYIFKLSDRWTWRFNGKANAVTLGEFQTLGEQTKYCDLRHVLDDGQESPAPFPDEICRVAYFDADPVSAAFHHPFNLNVELLFADVGTQPNTLPIVIDPDVRHPGGSGD